MPPKNGKFETLEESLRQMGVVAVAFSGGADSTLLLAEAHKTLGDSAVAVTVRSCAFPSREADEAERFCRERGIRHETLDFDPVSIPEFAANTPDRCYHCKKAIFSEILVWAAKNGFSHVAEGTNADDDGDYRPGRKAIAELGVASPLRDAGLAKKEIRLRLEELGFKVWNKPAAACLASRFPYGEIITHAALERVENAERFLSSMLPPDVQLRVRSHGNLARVETDSCGFGILASKRNEIAAGLKRAGFEYAAIDFEDYRTGRLNEILGLNTERRKCDV